MHFTNTRPTKLFLLCLSFLMISTFANAQSSKKDQQIIEDSQEAKVEFLEDDPSMS
jgi:hypothetical protein